MVPPASSERAESSIAALTAAPEEMPTRRPASARAFLVAMASSEATGTTSSTTEAS